MFNVSLDTHEWVCYRRRVFSGSDSTFHRHQEKDSQSQYVFRDFLVMLTGFSLFYFPPLFFIPSDRLFSKHDDSTEPALSFQLLTQDSLPPPPAIPLSAVARPTFLHSQCCTPRGKSLPSRIIEDQFKSPCPWTSSPCPCPWSSSPCPSDLKSLSYYPNYFGNGSGGGPGGGGYY